MSENPGDLTVLFQQWQAGEEGALDALMGEVYGEIRKMARGQLKGEYPTPSIQSTELANEAFLRLVKQNRLDPKNRKFFFGVVRRLMRNLLIDRSRRNQAIKRAAGRKSIPLEFAGQVAVEQDPTMSALDSAMQELRATRPLRAAILNLQIFCGLTHAETAQHLGLSVAKVRREWTAGRRWLEDRIMSDQP